MVTTTVGDNVTRGSGRFWAAPHDSRPPPVSSLAPRRDYLLRITAIPRRILVVEDDLDSNQTLVFLLRDMGHLVDFATDGYTALQIAERMEPDFVLLDLGLPGLSGFYVCSRIKSTPTLKHTRVIAITAYGSDEQRARSKAAGCELHLVKPVSLQTLAAMLESSSPQS